MCIFGLVTMMRHKESFFERRCLEVKKALVQAKFSGEYALFTRPEGKVERTSYSIMTPSAARGALESIMWKPEFHFRVRRIIVLKRPKFHSIVRNEVARKASVTSAFMKKPKDIFTDDMRQLRHSLILKDVSYIVEADIVLQDSRHSIKKYEAMFNRRLRKGQCFNTPYLGTREFSATFESPTGKEKPINWTDSLGSMFFDFRYPKKGSVTVPYFFNAHVQNGVMEVPDYLYKEVHR